MRIYVAASWESKERAKDIMNKLEQLGHTITMDWVTHEMEDEADGYAVADMYGVATATCLIFISDGNRSGGKHFELGYAVASNIPVLILDDVPKEDACVFVKSKWFQHISEKELMNLMSMTVTTMRVRKLCVNAWLLDRETIIINRRLKTIAKAHGATPV